MPLILNQCFKKEFGVEQISHNLVMIYRVTILGSMGISAHPHGANRILNGPFKGQTLDEVWENQPKLFGEFPTKKFPLLTKY